MTVPEVQVASEVLAKAMTSLAQEFETATGCVLHSIPIIAATKTQPVQVRVKVQIPE